MSDEKKAHDEANIIPDDALEDVHGGGSGGKPTTVTGKLASGDILGHLDGVNNDTLFAGPGDDSRFNLGMPPSKK